MPLLLALTDPGRLEPYPWQVLASLLYVGNYVRIAGHDLGVLNHLWSLSVEEQFYVVWPTVCIVVVTWFRARALSIVLALAGGATFYSVWTQGPAIRLDIATETNAFALLLGASLAFALAELRRRQVRLPQASPLVPFVVLIALSAFPGHGIGIDHDLFRPLGAVFAVVGLWLVYAAVSGHARLVGSRFMVFFGTISYALYLWHQALINSRLLGAHTLGRNLVLVAVAVLVAWLSWVLVERPVGRLRGRLRLDQPSRRQAAALAARARSEAETNTETNTETKAKAPAGVPS